MSISRRSILATAVALPAVSLLAGAPAASARSRRTFYLAENGNDEAAGTSTDAPWKSIDRVNKAMAEGDIAYGDTILFQRGQRFYGEFPSLPDPSGDERLTFGAYGKGDRPQIMGYKVLNKREAWSKAGANLWQIYLGDANNYFGNTSSTEERGGNVGLLRLNNNLHGNKKASVAELKADWDFHSDSTTKVLTICIPENPTGYGDLRVAVDGRIFQARSNTTIQGLDLIGRGGHGIQVVGASGVRIFNNRVRQIGGSELIGYSVPNTRYGNGIEMWIGSSDVMVESNIIYDVYDVAVTLQGEQENDFIGWKNVHVKNNRITRCSQSFEVWSRGNNLSSGAGYVNCSFTGNNCTDAGIGSWGYEARPNKDEGGVHLLAYNEELPMELSITGNRFIGAKNAYMYRLTEGKSRMVIDNNEIELAAGQRLQQPRPPEKQEQREETIEQHEAWSDATGFDKNSTFKIAGSNN